jgi:hypothetical protein
MLSTKSQTDRCVRSPPPSPPDWLQVCKLCGDVHSLLPVVIESAFEPHLFMTIIGSLNLFLKNCLDGIVLSATWRFCYNLTRESHLSRHLTS